MELNLNNWKVKLIRSTFEIVDDNKLPKSICTFFWTLVSSIVVFPFALFTHLLNIKFFITNNKTDINMGFFPGFLILLIFGVIGFKMSMIFRFIHINATTSDSDVWWISNRVGLLYYYATVALLLFIALIFAIFYISNLIKERYSNYKNSKKKVQEGSYIETNSTKKSQSIFFQYFKAVKDKICPIITYKK